MTRSLRVAALLLAASLALYFGVSPARAQGEAAPEARVKAAFLYKFLAYVEWPSGAAPTSDGPFVIGVTGADEIAAELEQLVPGRTVNGRPLFVRRLSEGDPVRGVSMLFVGRGASGRLPAVVRAAQPQGILIVSDTERGLEMGSVINLVVVEERVGFEVSLEAARRTGLTINSRMLPVARRVVPRNAG